MFSPLLWFVAFVVALGGLFYTMSHIPEYKDVGDIPMWQYRTILILCMIVIITIYGFVLSLVFAL